MLAKDWSKRVTWLNTPAKTREYHLDILPLFRKIFEDSISCKNKVRYLSLKMYYLFLKAHSFPAALHTENVRFSKQKMFGDKYPSIFSRQIKAIVYISSQWPDIVRNLLIVPFWCTSAAYKVHLVSPWQLGPDSCTKSTKHGWYKIAWYAAKA